MKYPEPLLKLISTFKKLPGIGTKSAERFAFHLLNWPEEKLQEMGNVIAASKKYLKNCPSCGALIDEGACNYCDTHKRDNSVLAVVASPKDIFLMEEMREYRGLYHVLGALFSPIHGLSPDAKALAKLKERIMENKLQEIVIALDSTLEGDATALYVKRELATFDIKISRLALGLPVGSSLDYIDGGTLARAFTGRHVY